MEGRAADARIDEWRFFEQVAALLGAGLLGFERKSPDVVRLDLSDGRRLIHKGVPRQEAVSWRPGRPWMELVWTDYLSAEGEAVPSVLAADLDNGWLVESFLDGETLDERFDLGVFKLLVETLASVERTMMRAPDDVRRFVAIDPPDLTQQDASTLLGSVDESLRPQVRKVAAEAFAGARPTLGPLDILPGNAIVRSDDVAVIDLATMGYDHTERRLAGYAWRTKPYPRSGLETMCFVWYKERIGEQAALRLLFYDLLYAALARSKCKASDVSRMLERFVSERLRVVTDAL